MITEWQIRTLQPAPSLMEDVVSFTGTYDDARNAARESHRKTGQRSAVVANQYYWFIAKDSGEIDRNTISR